MDAEGGVGLARVSVNVVGCLKFGPIWKVYGRLILSAQCPPYNLQMPYINLYSVEKIIIKSQYL